MAFLFLINHQCHFFFLTCSLFGHMCVRIPVCLRLTSTLFNSSPLPSAGVWLEPIQSWATCTEIEREVERGGERGKGSKRKSGQPLWCTLVVLATASLFAWSPNSPIVALCLKQDSAGTLQASQIPVDVFKWTRLGFPLLNFFSLDIWTFSWIYESTLKLRETILVKSFRRSCCCCLQQKNFQKQCIWKYGEHFDRHQTPACET